MIRHAGDDTTDPAPGQFIDPARVLARHNRCHEFSHPGENRALCQLEFGHPGPHADVSLSGLVLDTWPNWADGEDHL